MTITVWARKAHRLAPAAALAVALTAGRDAGTAAGETFVVSQN
jgi:hypothetical protein